MRRGAALLLALLAACAPAPTLQQRAQKILDFDEDLYKVADHLSFKTHGRLMQARYDRLLSGRLRDLRSCDDACLDVVFRGVGMAAFYSGSPAIVEDGLGVFMELERRGIATSKQVEEMHGDLLRVWRLNEARALAARYPKVELETTPTLVAGAPDANALAVSGERLVPERVSISGARILMLASPGCGFSRKTLDALIADPRTRERLVVLYRQNGGFAIRELDAWNRAHPAAPYHVVRRPEDWPQVDDWGGTPQLWFLRDGRVVGSLDGMPSEGPERVVTLAADALSLR